MCVVARNNLTEKRNSFRKLITEFLQLNYLRVALSKKVRLLPTVSSQKLKNSMKKETNRLLKLGQGLQLSFPRWLVIPLPYTMGNNMFQSLCQNRWWGINWENSLPPEPLEDTPKVIKNRVVDNLANSQ